MASTAVKTKLRSAILSYLPGRVVSPGYRQLPWEHRPFHRLSGDDTSSGTATARLIAYLGDADHRPSFLAYPPPLTGPKNANGPSAFLDGKAADDLSNPSSPAPRRPAVRRYRLPLAHLGSPPRPTIFHGRVFLVCFLFCFTRWYVFIFRSNIPPPVDTKRVPFRFPTPLPFLKARL